MGAAKDRRELESIVYFNDKKRKLEKRLKANNQLIQRIAAEKQRSNT